MLIPFFQREWHGNIDISTISSWSGASVSPVSSAPLSLWREFAVSQKWVAGFIKLSADTRLAEVDRGDQLSSFSSTFLLDLQGQDPILRASAIIRRKIRRAERAGVVLVNDRELLSNSLQRLYKITMDRVGASSFSRISPQVLEQWAHDSTSIILGAKLNGTVEAVVLDLVAGREAEDYITVTSDQYRWLTAWLLSKVINALQTLGVGRLNLGEGVEGTGLCEFKARFNGLRVPSLGMRQIYDIDKYHELCREEGVPSTSRWFPAYRFADRLGL